MPLNTVRLNHQKSSHPNDRIVFIKALPRPGSDQASYDLADTFLRAIAAQCLPIMKKHYLSVTTLEEYEPNREFIGRNFNNGEIIQLVLQSRDGCWLPFNMVQMVMMHELAHNSHMNHGKYFWQTRNLYSQEMTGLWANGYTGEGFWGSGRTLTDLGAVMGNNVLRSEELEGLPLCGGTFRSRRRKRRAAGESGELTWKEKRERRIEKKFGKNGVTLGEDEDKRLMLEIGKKGPIGGKPRVAQSQRGRELRAAAALARFATNKQVEGFKQEVETEDAVEYEDVDRDEEDAKDINGNRLLDSQGHAMIRVCDDEDTDDVNVKREMEEVEGLNGFFSTFRPGHQADSVSSSINERGSVSKKTAKSLYDIPEWSPSRGSQNSPPSVHKGTTRPSPTSKAEVPPTDHPFATTEDGARVPTDSTPPTTLDAAPSAPGFSLPPAGIECQVCSLMNEPLAATCVACAHVLDARKDPRHWRCTSDRCTENNNDYLNSGDAGICGVCGARKPQQDKRGQADR